MGKIDAKNIIASEVAIDNIKFKDINNNCITGETNHLLPKLRQAFKKATEVKIIVAFLKDTGVKLLEDDIRELVDRGVNIKILTGNYLNITEPKALTSLKYNFGDKIDLRFYNVKNKSFHPKAYIFKNSEGGEIYLGSSNMSRAALTDAIEWNYRIDKSTSPEDFRCFESTFDDLFLNHSTIIGRKELNEYAKTWRKRRIVVDDVEEDTNVIDLYTPTDIQLQCLYNLKATREEGFDRALVVAATGVGKTYLAAFDSKEYKKVLFVAHREEILKQAYKSFRNVRGETSTYGYFYGSTKDKDNDVVFALVQTLGKKEYLNDKYFKKDDFDYIIIDEFHHATASNYRKIIDYFTPKFLFGITATPERMDNKDVFAICDYNVAYEIRLKEAIEKDILCPYRYYGIYDNTVDYDSIDYSRGKYNETQLEKALSKKERADLVYNHYRKFDSKRALGFCTSKIHAEYMAEYFAEQGVKAVAVYSGGKYNRNEAIEKLASGEISVIFSIDMFNEGLDVPSIDMVMFLRPTESSTVFLQQLGRGLRKSKDKKYLNVLDFIGKYKKVNLVPLLLKGEDGKRSSGNRFVNPQVDDYPDGCLVDFDFKLIDIFKEEYKRSRNIKTWTRDEFLRIKEELGHTPNRKEFFLQMEDDLYINLKAKSKENIFKDYISFLNEMGEKSPLLDTVAHRFLVQIETTAMSKTYKMPLLLAFYNDGNMVMELDKSDIAKSFRNFYSYGSNGIDMKKHKSTEDYKSWNDDKYYKLAKDNPINALCKTHGEFFTFENDKFYLSKSLESYINNEEFLAHFKDIIDFRTVEYYKVRFENEI